MFELVGQKFILGLIVGQGTVVAGRMNAKSGRNKKTFTTN